MLDKDKKTKAQKFKNAKGNIEKKYGIIWEFFPTQGGGSSQFPKLLLFYHSPKKPLKHLKITQKNST